VAVTRFWGCLTDPPSSRDNSSVMAAGARRPLRRAVTRLSNSQYSWLETATRRFEEQTRTHGYIFAPWRVLVNSVQNFFENDDFLRASALTYTSTLSIVPILALAFSVLKGLGEADQVRPLVARYLALGSQSTSDQLMGFVENVNATALGAVGAAFLLGTVISTLGNIEQAFN
jgi:uncharacterized BrkB/YihY/UPF0761 family membrane protein